VWPDGIVVPSPGFDHDLCLFQRVEDLTIEQLITKLSVEALAVPIFPGTAWFYVGGLSAHGQVTSKAQMVFKLYFLLDKRTVKNQLIFR